jgi:uncharacterized protein with ATP-grasp and redox domains
MRSNLDCIPCFQRQALQALRFVSDDEEMQEETMRRIMARLLELEWDSTPPELAREVHRLVRERFGGGDPYAGVKMSSNQEALRLYTSTRNIVQESEDPLIAAGRIAIAGNIIDFGATPDYDLGATISEVMGKDFALDDTEEFRERLGEGTRLLYFLDNAGEIVFDKLFVETMQERCGLGSVDFVVKGGPILNDVTMDDALFIGLDKVSDSSFLRITNGDPGTGPARKSEEVESWIRGHDLTVSKGQGNYEEMSQYKDIFFLLLAKCPLIARDLSVGVGDVVFHRSR